MAKDLWLPKGFRLSDGSEIRSQLYFGDNWQIYDTSGSQNYLIMRPELAQNWTDSGLIDESLYSDVTFGTQTYICLTSHKKYILAPVDGGKSPENKVDALAFAFALKESRKFSDDYSFYDAVYVEQYSRLLPTWSLMPFVADDVVLGTWLTGGVGVSTDSFRRLANLTGWMPADDLAEILTAAGLSVPADAGLMAKRKPASQEKTKARKNPTNKDSAKAKHNLISGEETFRLPGRPQLEEFFNEHVIDIIFNAKKYQALGVDFPSAIILHGPPGCGKTYAVERLVEFIDWPSYSIDSNSVGSPYIHETSKKISEVFDKAIDGAPSVIVIDEMESFLSDRRSGSSSGLHHVEEVAEFLRRIPEAISSNVLIVAMTNLIDMIDPAILRRGRFDHIIQVDMPSREEVASLVDSLLSKLPRDKELNVDKLIDALTGKALSDTAFVVREASRIAARTGKTQLDQDSIEAALNSLPKIQEKQSRGIGFILDDK